MNLNWINDFEKAVRSLGIKAASERKANITHISTSSFEDSHIQSAHGQFADETIAKLVKELRDGLGKKYWTSLDPLAEMKTEADSAGRETGGKAAIDFQIQILNAITWTDKENKVRLRSSAKSLLFSMARSGDVFAVLWAERLAYLYSQQYETGDESRRFYVSYIFRAVKESNAHIKCVDGERERGQWLSLLKGLIARFEEVVNGFSDPQQQRFWFRFVVHYKTTVMVDDKELADYFVASRAEYYRAPDDIAVLTQYVWTICDCLDRALEIKERKVVEMFYDEGKKLLSRVSTLGEATADLEKDSLCQSLAQAKGTLVRILKLADAFLSGKLEAAAWLKKGEIDKAIATYQDALGKDKDNIVARIGLMALQVKLGKVKEAESLISEDVLTLDCLRQISKAVLAEEKDVRHACERARFVFAFLSRANLWDIELEPKDAVVAKCLYKCGMTLGKTDKGALGKPLVNEHPQLIDFFKRLSGSGFQVGNRGWTASDCLGRLLIATGRIDEARLYIKSTVLHNPDSPTAWTDFGRTFGENSIDGAKCFCKAILCPMPKHAMSMKAHELLGRYFENTNQIPRARLEYNIVNEICKENAWNPKKDSSRLLINSMFDGVRLPEPCATNEDVYAKLAESAGELISSEAMSVKGVVIGHPKGKIRIWHEPLPGESIGTEVYTSDVGYEEIKRGTPLILQINKLIGKESVAKYDVRNNGTAWDIYPKSIGVVSKIDHNRGFWSLVCEGGATVSVGDVDVPLISTCSIGDFVECCIVNVGGVQTICNVSPIKAPSHLPSFVRQIKGSCVKTKTSRFGFIDDVFVPERLCGKVPSGTQMTVLAVKTRNPRKREEGWLAVALA